MTHVWWHQSEASEQSRFGGAAAPTFKREKGESPLAFTQRLLEAGRHDVALSFANSLNENQRTKMFQNLAKRKNLVGMIQSIENTNPTVARAAGDLFDLMRQAAPNARFGNLPKPGAQPGAGGGGGGSFGFGGVNKGNWRQLLGGVSRQFPFDVQPFIDKAIRNASSLDEAGLLAQEYILGSNKFKTAYPGIFRSDGTLKMTVAEYLNVSEGYRSTAAAYGFSLNKDQMGQLVKLDVSPAEFDTRAKAVQIVQRNPDAFKALQRQVDEYNQNVPSDRRIRFNLTNPSSVVNFATGGGDRQVYDLFEAAQFEAAAQRQGIPLSGARARELARRTAGIAEFGEVQEGFQQIGSLLRDYDSELRAFGVGQRDLEEQAFGRQTGSTGFAIEQAQKQRQARLKGGAGTGPTRDLFSSPGA